MGSLIKWVHWLNGVIVEGFIGGWAPWHMFADLEFFAIRGGGGDKPLHSCSSCAALTLTFDNLTGGSIFNN